MKQRRIKLRVNRATTPSALIRLREVYWARLLKCAPFVRGTLSAVGPKSADGTRKTYALVCRQEDATPSTYIPRRDLMEVRKMIDNYVDAKETLALIADCNLRLLLWRINKRKQGEKSASKLARSSKGT
jgi:hypothetical protein